MERVLWKSSVKVDGREINGNNISLNSPHIVELLPLSAGRHLIEITVDNRAQRDISFSDLCHSYTNDTQTIWNGILGDFSLCAIQKVEINKPKVYPVVRNGTIDVVLPVSNRSGHSTKRNITLTVTEKSSGKAVSRKNIRYSAPSGDSNLKTNIRIDNPKLWSEFSPTLYRLTVKTDDSSNAVDFGMREVRSEGKSFLVNGKKFFLRGTLDCCVFPLTGVPPTDREGWKKEMTTLKEWGLNHIRFHSWCPPEAAFLPGEIKTVEQLYLTGLHLEQYRHATYSPVDYYEEGLRRDPDDVRCNNALGLWYIRKGRFDKAEKYLEKAVRILQKRNPNPYDGEPVYNLGLALKYQGRYDEAYDRFYKSTWNGAWQDAGYFACAQISCRRGNFEEALYEIDRSLLRNWHNAKARALKAAILIKTCRKEEADKLCIDSLEIDPFNYGCLFLTDETEKMVELMHGNAHNYDEIALDFCEAGLWDFAEKIWNIAIENGSTTPMTFYYLGYAFLQSGDREKALKAFEKGADECPDFVFPNRLEAIPALNASLEMNPEDANSNHYLGNLYYDKRQYDLALAHWEEASRLNPDFPTTWRNLALLYNNKCNDSAKAVEAMEKAFSLDMTDSRVLMELDQLYKKLQRPHYERLAFLQQYPELIEQRDDLILEEITLLNQCGRYEKAKRKLDGHQFHPWEGGEGKVPAQYQISRVELAKLSISRDRYEEAIGLLNECLDYPPHLGEGKLFGAQENDFYYLLGLCHKAMGDDKTARECFEKATLGPTEPAAAMYYNDAKPDKIFYAGLAWRALGNENKARSYFNRLVDYGKQHLHEKVVMDYFAVSLPDLQVWDGSLDEMSRIHCLYMLALGYWGLGDREHSDRYLHEAEKININHQGIQAFNSLKEVMK